jgi:general secretion pathway protein C
VSIARRIRTDAPMVLLRLTLVAVGAVLAADAANQWLVARWRIPLPPPRPPATQASQAPAHKAPLDLAAITKRQIFNSSPGTPAVAPPPTAPSAPLTVVEPLNLNVRLTGTVVGSSPDGSFAMIMDVAGRDEHLYRVGDKVLGEGTVVEIRRDLVRLKRGGAEQVLRLFEEEKPGTATVSVTPAGRAPVEVAPDQYHFVVDRGEIDEALSDMPRLLTQARLLPNFRAGQTDGFRIFNIVPGSIFARIGLKNGDVLHRINDIAIDDPTKFMGVFQGLKDESQISVDLVRGTERKTFEYEIR